MKHFKTKLIIIIATIVSLVAITIGVFAYISRISARGEINVSAATINAETTYTSSTNSFDWTYTEAGDTKEINITTNNQTGIILHRYYNIQLASGFTSNENLLKATIVYYNNKYIGTLNDIVNSNLKIEEEYNFIGLASNKTDGFKFELHQAARNSNLDNKDVKVTITTYTENADYYRYIFVHNEADFKKAIDDMNSGMLSEIPHIVLCNNITLQNNYTISEPTTIYLNGSTLNGSLTINDTTATNPNALLEVLGEGAFNATVTLGANYDHDGAVNLVKNHVKDVLKDGVLAGSTTNILGYYAFYGISVSAITRCTFTSPNIIVQNSSNEYYNALGTVKVNNDENINFKILGSKTELIDGTLAHLPQNGSTISLDLFLPTYIPNQNASITWKSSDESIITNTGKITADRLENAEVTLYAEIRVNETVLTRTFNFKVSAHNNEINFYKLVQEISPIVISNVRNSQADDDDALYHLPIVSESNGVYGTYDYRTSYTSPVNTRLFNWVAYRNIGLESITYSMSREQQKKFDYITLENSNELYLNNITLNNYASITITGNFGNDETYSTNINISISVGSNTQLLERTFTQISEELSQISILGNILSTRIQSGMANEKGDFSLSVRYLDQETNQLSEDYSVEYSGESNIIPSITYNSVTGKYDFSINPEYFNEYETTVAFTAKVYYRKGQSGATFKDRTFYITVPAALHIKDFGTISIYNATKYQVFNQLPAGEKTGTTGYTVSGSSLTDNNLDYILLRDIVGDADYLAQYNHNNTSYLEKINYTSSNYATGTESLSYLTSSTNPTSTTDTLAYDFARLIEWATGDTRVTASSVVSNTTALGSYASTKANAEDYLNNNEIAVLKQYYQYSTQASDAEWDSLFSEVFNVAPGYIYTNPALLNTVIAILGNNNISFRSSTTNYSALFGKYMEILQRYAVSTTKVNEKDVAPCQEQYNSTYTWYHSTTNLSSFSLLNSNGTIYNISVTNRYQVADNSYWLRGGWPSDANAGSGGDGKYAGFYAIAEFAADRTSYITKAERQVIMMFWLNVTGNNLTTEITNNNKTKITNVLNEYSDYYSDYSISHFNDVVHAIINAFDACMEIPTYFSTDGVSKIIKSFYDKKNYELPSYDGTKTNPFVSSLSSSIPYITNADNIKSILSYFVKLKTLTFNGNDNLAVFLSENGLSTVFARTGLYNKQIQTLTMKHVAHTSVNFDLTNIKNFANLTVLDLSYNSGIQSVNELVNVNRSNYTAVNIEHIGVEAEYQEYAIDNIASPTCTVRYTNASGVNTYSNDSSRASELAELSDFNKFITKYMYMTNVLYEDGNETQVTWRIDEGNEINKDRITNGGNYPSLSTIDEMNQLISPYYYCTQSFTYNNLSFESGKYYRVYYENNTLKRQLLGECISSNSLNVSDTISQLNIDTSVPASSEFSGETYNTGITTTRSIVSGTESTYDTNTWYNNNTTNVFNVNWTITNTYKIQMRDSYYLYCNNISNNSTPNLKLASSVNSDNASQFFFLDHETVVNVLKKNYTDTVNLVGYKYNEIPDSNMYHMCVIYESNLYCVGSTQDYVDPNTNDVEISITNNISDLLYISYNSSRFTFSNSKNLRMNSSHLPSYHKQPDNTGITFTVSTTINQTVPRSSFFKVNYTNGESEYIDAYAVGYRVYHVTNAVFEYVDTETTEFLNHPYESDAHYLYYTGSDSLVYDQEGNEVLIKPNSILKVYANYKYPVTTRSRSYFLSGDFYIWKLWYITNTTDYNDFINGTVDASGYIFGDLIQSVKLYYGTNHFDETASMPYNIPSDTIDSRTNGADWDDWQTPLTSSWQYDNVYFSTYISYVSSINQSSYDLLDKQSNYYDKISSITTNHLFKYSGPTGTATVYKGSSGTSQSTYNRNYGYKLVISNNQLSWQQYSTSLSNPTGATMDSLLATANSHFNDFHYGEYYGKYYGYSGSNFYSSLGRYYDTGYVYRIMPNASNTAFEWVKVSQYITNTSDEILKSLGVGAIHVGDICYSTTKAGFGFFNSGWYKVILDEKTNIVNLVKFNDVGFLTNGSQTYTRLTNDKLVPRDGDYLGYSGTFTIRISAMIRTYNSSTGTWTEYIKTYKLKFVGSLTS